VNLHRFRASLRGETPPDRLTPALQALWWAGKGEWDRAHGCVDHESTADACWVHAHLHRLEGDAANAAYWYRQAGRSPSTVPFEQEWAALAEVLLGGQQSAIGDQPAPS
jgi:hypothetical protein